MSFCMHGVGVSGGIAIGHAQLISHAVFDVPHYVLPNKHIDEELKRFDTAIETVRNELQALREHIPPNAPAELSGFLDLHLMLLNDTTLSKVPKDLIKTQKCNAEWALKQQMDALIGQFEEIEDSYLRERKADVGQVVERILKALMGHPSHVPMASNTERSIILVAHDLSPADVMLFKRHQFAAFITDVGGATSHTAILARSLNIPSIVALHHARQLIHEQELLIVDGHQGVVIVNPDKAVLAEYRLRQNQWEIERQKLKRIKSTRASTLDGTPIELHANIELPQDVEDVKAAGATGIGLFRSEFLFLNRHDLPSEEEQFAAYRKVAEDMDGYPVIVRTLDIGADKHLDNGGPGSSNSALGLRAIRFCLSEPQLFNTQLRAILRATHYGKVHILIPMLSSLNELYQTFYMIKSAKESLRHDGLPFNEKTLIGGMIEIPAAALTAQLFAKNLDFLSIGTNDLIQYTLAIDRTDDTVAQLYDPLHPAILQLIAHTIKIANKSRVPISVCGEMAGDPNLTRLLLGFGLREFSMHPAHLLEVKQQILRTSLPQLNTITQKLLRSSDPQKIRELVAQLNS